MFDVIPRGSFEGLTAEDFRLLLNGMGDISTQALIGYTSFNDESGERKFNQFCSVVCLVSLIAIILFAFLMLLMKQCQLCTLKQRETVANQFQAALE